MPYSCSRLWPHPQLGMLFSLVINQPNFPSLFKGRCKCHWLGENFHVLGEFKSSPLYSDGSRLHASITLFPKEPQLLTHMCVSPSAGLWGPGGHRSCLTHVAFPGLDLVTGTQQVFIEWMGRSCQKPTYFVNPFPHMKQVGQSWKIHFKKWIRINHYLLIHSMYIWSPPICQALG